MPNNSEQRRFNACLNQTCTIQRKPVSNTIAADLGLGVPEEVATVACRVSSIETDTQRIMLGPMPVVPMTLFVAWDTDLQHKDEVVLSGEVWLVRDPPQKVPGRIGIHHIEAILDRKVVQ